MSYDKFFAPGIGMHIQEQRSLFAKIPEKAGLWHAFGDNHYDTVLHLNCCSVSGFNDVSMWAQKMYYVLCPDSSTYNMLLSHYREIGLGRGLLVSLSKGSVAKSEKKLRFVDIVYLDRLHITSRLTAAGLHDMLRNLLRTAKRLVIHTILAESLGQAATISSADEWSNVGVSRDTSISPFFFHCYSTKSL